MKSERQPPSESVIIMVPVKPSNSTSEEMPDCDNEGTSGNVLEHVWPLIFSLKLFGLYFVNDIKKSGDGCFKNIHCHTPSERARSFFDNPLHLYSFGVLVMLWLNVARMTSVFTSDDVFGNVLFSKIGVFTWMLMCALLCTGYYTACRGDMFRQISKSVPLSSVGIENVKRKAAILTLVAWFGIVGDTCIVIYGLFFSEGMVNYMLAPCHSMVLKGDFRVPKTVYLIVNVYLNGSWMFPIAMNAIVSSIFYNQLTNFNNRFQTALHRAPGQMQVCFDEVIETFRQEHQSITRMIKKGDRFMALMNGILVVSQYAILITMFYNLIFFQSPDPVLIFACVFWIISALIGLGIAATGCIAVNNAVCIPYLTDKRTLMLFLIFNVNY